jgi:N-acetylmuramic acid 6-phosphate etherase
VLRDDLPKTELTNPLTRDMDTWPALRIVQAMSTEDHRVASAVARELPKIAAAADLVAKRLRAGGRVFYLGSGSSGRIGVLDASELEPTFGALGRRFTALIAGGPGAVFRAAEGTEDSADAGRQSVLGAGVTAGDVVVGIASSGRTPFVCGALEAAREAGGSTVAVVGDTAGPVAQAADLVIAPDVGPEVVAGSTRLKNGTAQKLVLNMISTAAMVLAGRTYSNLMAGTSPRNAKLSDRARSILLEATGRQLDEVEAALQRSGGDIPVALVSLMTGISAEEAGRILEENGGAIRQAVQAARGRAGSDPAVASGTRGVESRQPQVPPLPSGPAREAGLDEAQIERAFNVVREAVGDGEGEIPGAVAAIVHQGVMVGPRAFGLAVRAPERITAEEATIFDLASLTKVVATTPSALIACERGLFRLDDPVACFIPEFGCGNKEDITLRHLLTHTSGLPAHVKFWEKGLRAEEVPPFIFGMRLAEGAQPGTQVIYSDLGFIVLGEVLRRVTGVRVDEFAAREVFAPLGMADTRFLPPEEERSRIAATEYRADLGRVMWGEVHDENALALGGVAGHAGLFSTAEDIARYALVWLGKGQWQGIRILSKATVAAATSEETDSGERRGLGWVLKSGKLSSGGDLLSARSYGHTGFTGTSLWCDPETGTAVILLTNRVHAGREGDAIIRLRPRFANAVAAARR